MSEISFAPDVGLEKLFLLLVGKFPEREAELVTLLGKGLLNMSSPASVFRDTRDLLCDHITRLLLNYKVVLSTKPKEARDLRNAYFDIHRYQTHVDDAADDWFVDEEILKSLIKHVPLTALADPKGGTLISKALQRKRELPEAGK